MKVIEGGEGGEWGHVTGFIYQISGWVFICLLVYKYPRHLGVLGYVRTCDESLRVYNPLPVEAGPCRSMTYADLQAMCIYNTLYSM